MQERKGPRRHVEKDTYPIGVPIAVVLAEDNALLRHGLARLIEDNWAFFRAYDTAVQGAGTALIEQIKKRIAELTAEGAV